MTCGKILRRILYVVITFGTLSFFGTFYLYQPKLSGTVYLPKAPAHATIRTEEATGIAHIHGDTLEATLYAQGYQHASTRLWQMYKNKYITAGRLSELVGERALGLDKFARTIGYRRIAEATYETFDLRNKKMFQAYADGVNDFVDSIRVGGYVPGVNDFFEENFGIGDGSANLLPPEFYLFGLEIEPWTPIDSLCSISLIGLSLTWDWAQDMQREITKMENEAVSQIAEELTPYTKEYLYNFVTVLDEADLRAQGKWSDKTLIERYYENLDHLRAAEPDRSKLKRTGKRVIQDMELSDIVGDKVDDAHHSNNWVISGKHTTTGKPMLANDPHLGTSLPSFWTLNEVRWEDKWLIGASAPGIPLIGIGRGPNTSFGQTSPLSDNSDLWQETLDASLTKYFVDGEWRNLELRKEVFKVKGAADVEYIVRSTHRGPIFQPKVMANGGVLFGSGMPKTIDFDGYYSHMWGGMFPGDQLAVIVEKIANGAGVKQILDHVNSLEDGYKGLPANFVMADDSGDIGYVMLMAFPNRRDKTPYIGNRVLNGEVTDYDWDGLVPGNRLPQSYNPKRGYICTANNRHMPDNLIDDIGATSMSTSRAIRIDEMIRNFIDSGHKISVADMQSIQQDDTDVMAREFYQIMIEIARSAAKDLSSSQRENLNSLFPLFDGWQGRFSEDSIPATVYTYTVMYFYESLLKNYIADEESRMFLVGDYTFFDFYKRLLKDVYLNKENSDFNKFCAGAHPDYAGQNICAYNLATSFVKARAHLIENVSSNSRDWKWANVHANKYSNMPFSMTPLRYLFHREVPTFGNTHTPHVSKVNYVRSLQDGRFQSTHVAGYKQVIAHGEANIYSIDTGVNGNLFAGHYFDMNKDHLAGDLYEMLIGTEVEKVPHQTLEIKNARTKKVSVLDTDL